MNFTALLRTSVLAVAVCLVTVSCGNENKNNNTAPAGGYSDASGTVSGEFVFPGEASNTTENNNVPKDTEAVTAEDIAEFLSEYTDISKYREISGGDSGSVLYFCQSPTEIKNNLPESFEFFIGAEGHAVTLPTTLDKLLEKGFTPSQEGIAETKVEAGENGMVTLLTPEKDDLVCFHAKNTTDEAASVASLPINSIMLTSYNKYTTYGEICGTSDISFVLKALGEPDVFGITASEDENSVMLEYSKNGTNVYVLADFDTKSVMALNVFVSDDAE